MTNTPIESSHNGADDRATQDSMYDVVIIGGGIAGLSVALTLPDDLSVALVTKAALGESNTRYAQGGLAAAVGLDDDPALHLRDTLAAGAGLVDETATWTLVADAREAVAWLIGMGAQFDARADAPATALPNVSAHYDLTLEGAHSRRRVLHARDATGAEIERALVAAIRSRPHTTILEQTLALDLLVENGRCVGVELLRANQREQLYARRAVVLANGGAGRLWLRTSNPSGATADGMAMAWRAGAALADLEFAQFHPTVLTPPGGRGEPFLVSEAVRGEGAYLRNAKGERFMERYSPQGELAPRDVVARAILSEMLAENAPSAFLDLRHLPAVEVHERFPTIAAACARAGLDLATDLIPVAPAAHYFMGGVVVDTEARTTLPRLYAVGEAACTGVHGANRLASNSLLEGLVFGRRAAHQIALDTPEMWPTIPALPGDEIVFEGIVTPRVDLTGLVAAGIRMQLQRVMWEWVSLRRDAERLTSAQKTLRALAGDAAVDPETANLLLVAQLVVAAALARTESRGGHYRLDYPDRDVARDGRHMLLVPGATSELVTVAPETAVAHA
jgi:L-aspartate oxidase